MITRAHHNRPLFCHQAVSPVALVALVCLTSAGWAQPSVTASTDKTEVALDETLTLTIKVSGAQRASQPDVSSLTDFDVLGQYRSQSISIVGFSQSVDTSFRYTLRPREEGQAKIPAIGVNVDGQTLNTRPITVSVVAPRGPRSSVPSVPSPPRRPGPRSPFGEPPAAEGDVIVRCEPDKTEAYVGEQILLTFSLYYAIPLQNADYEPAETKGFRTQPLPSPPRSYDYLDGRRYMAQRELKLLFPTAPGTQTIGPASLEYTTGFWDPVPQRATTEPISITVLRLPEAGKPEGYSGVVGELNVRTLLDRDTIEQGEAATLTAIVTGWGNIDALEAPKVDLPAGLREYRSSEHHEFEPEETADGYRMQGEAVFDNVIIPTTVGDLTIPAVEVAYFDPEARAYRTARSRPLTLHVAPSAGGSPTGLPASPAAGQLKPLPDRLRPRPVDRVMSVPLILSQTAAVVWLVATGLVYRRRKALAANPKLARAWSAARRSIGTIRAPSGLDPATQASEIAGAVSAYLGAKLDLPPATVSAGTARGILVARGVAPDLADRTANLLRACDSVRFAPAPGRNISEAANEAEAVVRALEKALGRGLVADEGAKAS